MDDFDDIDDELEDESPLDIPPEYRDLNPVERKRTVAQLRDLYLRDRLNLQPEFQREHVWDDKKSSRFIESILLNLPVPPIFVAENEDGSFEVVDGHQRLQAIFNFLRAFAPTRERFVTVTFKALRLKGLEVLDELNGRGVNHLSEDQRDRLMNRELTVISIPKKADPDLRFVLFERLNLGAVPLNAQELRNCIYRGPYNSLIREVGDDGRILALLGRKQPLKRMRGRELVLRFFALLHRRDHIRPFQMFLNDEMEANRFANQEELQQFRWEFSQAVDWCTRIFKQEACQLFVAGNADEVRGRWEKSTKVTDLMYEVEAVSCAEFARDLARARTEILDGFEVFLRGLRHRLIGVMCTDAFIATCGEFSRGPTNTSRRFSLWTGAFSAALRNAEYVIEEAIGLRNVLREGQACYECLAPLNSFDDSRLIPNTGRAAHRSCFQRWAATLHPDTPPRSPRAIPIPTRSE